MSDLAEVIKRVTDTWDEPLDEVHDIPQVVNAILASDWAKEALALVRADLRADAMIRSYNAYPVFTVTDVFDIAARYTPEWVDQVLTSRREENSNG